MAVVKNRLLLMLYLLDNSDQPLQARQLAAMAGVSERTVKNDMAELRELAQASGVEILTRQRQGLFASGSGSCGVRSGPRTASDPFQHDELHQK